MIFLVIEKTSSRTFSLLAWIRFAIKMPLLYALSVCKFCLQGLTVTFVPSQKHWLTAVCHVHLTFDRHLFM